MTGAQPHVRELLRALGLLPILTGLSAVATARSIGMVTRLPGSGKPRR